MDKNPLGGLEYTKKGEFVSREFERRILGSNSLDTNSPFPVYSQYPKAFSYQMAGMPLP
jgi:hypothetical protein